MVGHLALSVGDRPSDLAPPPPSPTSAAPSFSDVGCPSDLACYPPTVGGRGGAITPTSFYLRWWPPPLNSPTTLNSAPPSPLAVMQRRTHHHIVPPHHDRRDPAAPSHHPFIYHVPPPLRALDWPTVGAGRTGAPRIADTTDVEETFYLVSRVQTSGAGQLASSGTHEEVLSSAPLEF
jgi:hypothetical protein